MSRYRDMRECLVAESVESALEQYFVVVKLRFELVHKFLECFVHFGVLDSRRLKSRSGTNFHRKHSASVYVSVCLRAAWFLY